VHPWWRRVVNLAEARMKSVGDVCFSLLFAGSMPPFRAKPASHLQEQTMVKEQNA
jgi:hypothetical protein